MGTQDNQFRLCRALQTAQIILLLPVTFPHPLHTSLYPNRPMENLSPIMTELRSEESKEMGRSNARHYNDFLSDELGLEAVLPALTLEKDSP